MDRRDLLKSAMAAGVTASLAEGAEAAPKFGRRLSDLIRSENAKRGTREWMLTKTAVDPPGYVRPKVYTEPLGPDPRVQRITRNLFERMRA